MHTHLVFFWLKEPDNQDHRAQFRAGLAHLVQDPKVGSFKVGGPASTSRDVVESGYDYGLIAEFDDLAAHNAYQKGDCHEEFLRLCKHLWSAVQVFDLAT